MRTLAVMCCNFAYFVSEERTDLDALIVYSSSIGTRGLSEYRLCMSFAQYMSAKLLQDPLYAREHTVKERSIISLYNNVL